MIIIFLLPGDVRNISRWLDIMDLDKFDAGDATDEELLKIKEAGLLARAVVLPVTQDSAQVYLQLLPMSMAKLELNLKDPTTGEMGECGLESPLIPAISFMASQMGSAGPKTFLVPQETDHCGMETGLGLLPVLLITGAQEYGK